MTKEDVLKKCNIQVDRLKEEKPMLLHNILKAMDYYAEQVKSLDGNTVKLWETCLHKQDCYRYHKDDECPINCSQHLKGQVE